MLVSDSGLADRGNEMADMVLVSATKLNAAAEMIENLAIYLTDWLEEHDRSEDDIARIESLGASFLSASQVAATMRRSVWIVAAENEEALPDAWVFSSREAAIGWLVDQVATWIAENAPAEIAYDADELRASMATGNVDEAWERILMLQDVYDTSWMISFTRWERMIDGGGSLPL